MEGNLTAVEVLDRIAKMGDELRRQFGGLNEVDAVRIAMRLYLIGTSPTK